MNDEQRDGGEQTPPQIPGNISFDQASTTGRTTTRS